MRRILTVALVVLATTVAATGCRAAEPPRASLVPTSTTAAGSRTTTSTGRSTTTAARTTTTARPTTTTTAAPRFTEHARVSTWYTDAAADNSVWVHFKAVDGDGRTVAEVPGSDLMDLEKEADGAARTAARVALVDRLRQAMKSDGWTETGVDGEWYEYTFGR